MIDFDSISTDSLKLSFLIFSNKSGRMEVKVLQESSGTGEVENWIEKEGFHSQGNGRLNIIERWLLNSTCITIMFPICR